MTFTVKMIDLGPAGPTAWKNIIADLIQSPVLRAPEVIVGAVWGKPADIWSLRCLVYELAMGEFLISHTVDEMSVPYLRAIFLGPHPRTLKKDGKCSHMFFKDDGSQLHPQSERYPLADTIRRRWPPGDSDTEGLVQFLDFMLRLDSGERATLQTLLEQGRSLRQIKDQTILFEAH
ncbi:kinase-like domain-containing protein [Mycena alexandri]|uniref:non-specific serine/threonine protein kinase n=1 Tax=Mycena alexandri TaxID=1745969 RepID=A0AAD6XEV4_9AGAR|nr:kinase-like domain-containing protein [Mycena alexandri]